MNILEYTVNAVLSDLVTKTWFKASLGLCSEAALPQLAAQESLWHWAGYTGNTYKMGCKACNKSSDKSALRKKLVLSLDL